MVRRRPRNPAAYVGVLVAVLVAAWVTGNFGNQSTDSEQAQIEATLELIERGGPFPHRQDGSVFENREGRLPSQPRGYYREYTVPTPGESDRGARRIVVGQNGDKWYTRDHYRTFVRLD